MGVLIILNLYVGKLKHMEFWWLAQGCAVSDWKIKDPNLNSLAPPPNLLNTLLIIIILEQNEWESQRNAVSYSSAWVREDYIISKIHSIYLINVSLFFWFFGSLSLKLHAAFGMSMKLRCKIIKPNLSQPMIVWDCSIISLFIILVVVLHISVMYARHVHVPSLLIFLKGGVGSGRAWESPVVASRAISLWIWATSKNIFQLEGKKFSCPLSFWTYFEG